MQAECLFTVHVDDTAAMSDQTVRRCEDVKDTDAEPNLLDHLKSFSNRALKLEVHELQDSAFLPDSSISYSDYLQSLRYYVFGIAQA